MFYSVSTPSVFMEIELPKYEEDWTPRHDRALQSLKDLAELHGASIVRTSYRIG